MQSVVIAAVLSALAGLFLIVSLKKQHSQLEGPEPPEVSSRIPYLGHMIGALTKGTAYWTTIKLPIFTIDLGLFRFYVATDPTWLRAVGRNARIQFHPFLTVVNRFMADIPEAKLQPFHDAPEGKGVSKSMLHDVGAALSAKHVGVISVTALNSLSKVIESKFASGKAEVVPMFDWVRHLAAFAVSEAVYGKMHPFRDPKVEAAFWEFEYLAPTLFMSVTRFLLGKRARHHRDIFAQCLAKYYDDGGLEDASSLAHVRHSLSANEGFNNLEIARMEVPFTFGILAGSPGTAFFTLHNIVSRPELLVRIREELQAAIIREDIPGSQQPKFSVVLQRIKDLCPLLFSVYQETLRMRSTFTTGRYIAEDTKVSVDDQTYFLKGNSLIVLPPHAVNHDLNAWGPDAYEFDPERFIKLAAKGSKNAWRFRAFGGPPALCPGRHFGTTEVMAIAAMMLVRFDIEPVSKDGWPKEVKQDNNRHGQGVAAPIKDIEVRITPREGWKGEWNFSMGCDTLLWALESG